ncbi:DUF6387 family protein [Thalassotalea montiporae]
MLERSDMGKIKDIDDLPKWFKLENYKYINQLSANEIKDQLVYREDIHYQLRFIDLDKFYGSKVLIEERGEILFSDYILNQRWKQIKTGQVIIDKFCYPITLPESESMAGYAKKLTLPSSLFIRGVSNSYVQHYISRLLEAGLVKTSDDGLSFPVTSYCGDIDLSNKDLLFTQSGSININIDLYNATDKVIIQEIKKMLPLWRKSLDIEEPKNNYFSRRLDYDKVPSYKIIPLLDLLMWAQIEQKKIPLRVLTSVLFPKGEKGETELKQTILPMARRFISSNYFHIS